MSTPQKSNLPDFVQACAQVESILYELDRHPEIVYQFLARHHPAPPSFTPESIRKGHIQHAMAKSLGFAKWADLKHAHEQADAHLSIAGLTTALAALPEVPQSFWEPAWNNAFPFDPRKPSLHGWFLSMSQWWTESGYCGDTPPQSCVLFFWDIKNRCVYSSDRGEHSLSLFAHYADAQSFGGSVAHARLGGTESLPVTVAFLRPALIHDCVARPRGKSYNAIVSAHHLTDGQPWKSYVGTRAQPIKEYWEESVFIMFDWSDRLIHAVEAARLPFEPIITLIHWNVGNVFHVALKSPGGNFPLWAVLHDRENYPLTHSIGLLGPTGGWPNGVHHMAWGEVDIREAKAVIKDLGHSSICCDESKNPGGMWEMIDVMTAWLTMECPGNLLSEQVRERVLSLWYGKRRKASR